MENTRSLIERFQALKELERLESAASNPTTAGSSLAAALLAGHQTTRNFPVPPPSRVPPQLHPRFPSPALPTSYLDRALLASDPLLSQSTSSSSSASMVDRLAEENLILKRRLLMRESMETARAMAAATLPRRAPATSILAAQSREALKLLNERPTTGAAPAAVPRTTSMTPMGSIPFSPATKSGAAEHACEKRNGEATDAKMNDAKAKTVEKSATTAGDTSSDNKLTEPVPGHPELKVPLSSLSFPLKLYRMLEDAEKDGYDHIISFTPDGLSFQVHDREKFVKDIMPKYFKMGQFASFHRQLNCYGFERINRGTEHSAFYHEMFQRGNKKVLQRLKRKKQRVPGGDGRTLDDDRAAAIKALMGIHRNAHVLLGNNL